MSYLASLPLPERDPSGGRVLITSPYGPRPGGTHYGVDFGSTDGIEIGTAIFPVQPGTIVRYQYDGPFRNGIHTAGHNMWFMGDDGSRWKYFHMNGPPIFPINTHVPLNQKMAEVGNSGTQAAHLHLENHIGSWSNPTDFTFDARAAINAGRWPGETSPLPLPPLEDLTMKALLDSDSRWWQFLFDGYGRPRRFHIPNPTYLSFLKGAGIIEEDPYHLTAEQQTEFFLIPEVNENTIDLCDFVNAIKLFKKLEEIDAQVS